MIIILLGAPGSGKGTQAAMIAKKFSIPAISTGEVLRSEVAKGSDLGTLIKATMGSGALIGDDMMIRIIKSRIDSADCSNGFVLDGFPRTVSQARYLDELMFNSGRTISAVFNFNIKEDDLINRICGRFFCKKCGALYNSFFRRTKVDGICDNCGSDSFQKREDDGSEEAVKNRLKNYRETTSELIGFYQKKNLLVSVDALQSPPLIFQGIVNYLTN